MKTPVFALVDCNNFFVSCERLFRPDLAHKPVVVLSSNDGCVVARSNEAKALGIPMGAPAFQWRDTFDRHKVTQFSANFELYGDTSRRITALLASITPNLELYSIDEAFLDLSQLPINDFTQWGKEVRAKIWQWVGIPVSIGIAPTKTLAKLASEHAKKDSAHQGVLSLQDQSSRPYLEHTPIQDIWGIGWRLTPRLKAEGIHTAWGLALMTPRRAQQLMGIRGRQVVSELNEISCFPLERKHKPRQTIARTRTFGHDTNSLSDLEAAIATFCVRASFRLRENQQLARHAGLFLTTNRKKPNYQSWQQELRLQQPTADPGSIITQLVRALSDLHQPATHYHRAGIWLSDFVPAKSFQPDLFGNHDSRVHELSSKRAAAFDDINKRFGKGTITYAATKLGTTWNPIRQNASPAYTTDWSSLPIVD
ncbi:Y-family DNA polymerase [Candidatus Saccharibacteria bacterium]|nr:Y-family DNA polymerase [Candidatus Saccharibacteria bacterium]